MNAQIIIRVFLGIALLTSLFVTGARLYRRLPGGSSEAAAGLAGENQLIITMSDGELNGQGDDVAIELYKIDIKTLESEFATDPRPSRSFDNFLAQRLKGKSPVRAELDQNRRATLTLAPGAWWIHARVTRADGESIEWRLPISVATGRNTVELTKENMYERTKKF